MLRAGSAAPPRLRGSPRARAVALLAGLALFALGIVFCYQSRLGLSPWDVFNQGIANYTPLSFGTANVAVAVAVLAIAWRLGASIGPGTIANAVLIGMFVDSMLRLDAIEALSGVGIVGRALLLGTGILAIAVGSALYIGAGMGAGPRDTLMLRLSQLGRIRIGWMRTALEGAVTLFGFLLGGRVGIGTLVFALTIGPSLEAAFALVRHSALADHRVGPLVGQPPAALVFPLSLDR